MKLTMLGTGNALVTRCYNTCFVLKENENYLLVDGGGGNELLNRLERAGIALTDIHEIFVTHKHIDHLLGILWLLRVLCQKMNSGSYEGVCRLYAHDEVIGLLQSMADSLLGRKIAGQLGKGLLLIPVSDGETQSLLGRRVTFFDIGSTKAKQFGFTMELDGGEKLTCCGDEPCSEKGRKYARGAAWLLHEAFCLERDAEEFRPYEKHHSTVADACRLAEELKVKNLVLYHTEDRNLSERRALYGAEGRNYYRGGLYIPDDMESIHL